jgi:hypothetical protein
MGWALLGNDLLMVAQTATIVWTSSFLVSRKYFVTEDSPPAIAWPGADLIPGWLIEKNREALLHIMVVY